MSNIPLDKIIVSSGHPGFGYSGTETGTLIVTGSIPHGGANISTNITVPADSFCIGYYQVSGSSNLHSIGGSGTYAAITGTGYPVRIWGRQSGTTYTVTVNVGNSSGGTLGATYEQVNIKVYLFRNPFA